MWNNIFFGKRRLSNSLAGKAGVAPASHNFGDWYVAVVPEGKGTIGRGVRICTSGGASTSVPGLAPAIANAYRLLISARNKSV